MVKFVYFDLGGVVVEDFSKSDKWIAMKKIMGVKPSFEKEYDDLYDKYEKEDICLTRNVDTLIPIFAKKFGMKFPKNFSMNQYFVDHFDPNKSIFSVISEMQKTCKIGLLTNMYVDMLGLIFRRKILPPIKWDVIIDSSIVKMKKPNKNIYKYSQKEAGVKGNEILFVDNKQDNLNTAKELGWQTFFYDSADYQKSSDQLMKYYMMLQTEKN